MRKFVMNLSFWMLSLNSYAHPYTENSDYSRCRPNITFVMKASNEGITDQYYQLATDYYSSQQEGLDFIIVDTCSSILSIRNHLYNGLPHGSEGWGKVNIVAHGNPWTGLSIPILIGGKRTTVDGLIEAITLGTLAPLPDHIIDRQTAIDLKACGLGTNKEWLEAFQFALGGFDDHRPEVLSSEDFIQYGHSSSGTITMTELRPYYAFYKTAYKPSDLHLAKQLTKRYPEVDIDWLGAMRKKMSIDSEPFHDRFNVPIEWYVPIVDDTKMADLSDESHKTSFVKQQVGLMGIIEQYDIPIEKFRWTLSTQHKDGQEYILIKGKATVLCILQQSSNH